LFAEYEILHDEAIPFQLKYLKIFQESLPTKIKTTTIEITHAQQKSNWSCKWKVQTVLLL